jgi:hypothetical protein
VWSVYGLWRVDSGVLVSESRVGWGWKETAESEVISKFLYLLKLLVYS